MIGAFAALVSEIRIDFNQLGKHLFGRTGPRPRHSIPPSARIAPSWLCLDYPGGLYPVITLAVKGGTA